MIPSTSHLCGWLSLYVPRMTELSPINVHLFFYIELRVDSKVVSRLKTTSQLSLPVSDSYIHSFINTGIFNISHALGFAVF